jgi:hypothetical protein
MASVTSLLSKWPLIRQIRDRADGSDLQENGMRKM